jgi:hypothetical protein
LDHIVTLFSPLLLALDELVEFWYIVFKVRFEIFDTLVSVPRFLANFDLKAVKFVIDNGEEFFADFFTDLGFLSETFKYF